MLHHWAIKQDIPHLVLCVCHPSFSSAPPMIYRTINFLISPFASAIQVSQELHQWTVKQEIHHVTLYVGCSSFSSAPTLSYQQDIPYLALYVSHSSFSRAPLMNCEAKKFLISPCMSAVQVSQVVHHWAIKQHIPDLSLCVCRPRCSNAPLMTYKKEFFSSHPLCLLSNFLKCSTNKL